MDFKVFSQAVHKRYESLAHGELYTVNIDNIFDHYLAAFPEGTNPIYRIRAVYDCNCCKQFIRKLGTLVGLTSAGEVISVWDDLDQLPHPFNVVAERLSQLVRQAPIRGVFRTKEQRYGTEYNYDTHTNERWDHFFGAVVDKHFARDPETKRGEKDGIFQVMSRGLRELKISDLNDVIDLIQANGLYRGAEYLDYLKDFRKLKLAYDNSEESFVTPSAPKNTKLEIALEIVKDVIATKQAENAAAQAKVKKTEDRKKLLDALSAKKDQILTTKTVEELEAQLAALED